MDCSYVRNKLQEHIEGEIPQAQQDLIEEHLRSCEQCILYASELRKTLDTLRRLEEVEPPAWLTARVMKKIQEETRPGKKWIEKLFFPLHIKLPIEAMAALLITVAAIFIFKNMGPELKQIEVQSRTPAIKSMPAVQEKELQKQEMKRPQRPREETKQKDNSPITQTRELKTLKEERYVEQPAQSPAAPYGSAPAFSSAPSPAPSSDKRQPEAGKASGMAARDEVMQRSLPAESRTELAAEKKAPDLTIITLTVKVLDAAKKEIASYLSRNNGELKIIEQAESRIIIEVKPDPAKTAYFLTHLDSLGTIKEDRQTLSLQSGSFKIIINKH